MAEDQDQDHVRFEWENNEFITPTEIQELLSIFLVKENDGPLSPGSDNSQGTNHRSSTTTTTTSTHSSLSNEEERKLRRMISNRESARRSRWRKKRRLEDLTKEVKDLKMENRELRERFGQVLNRSHLVFRQNEQLWLESVQLGSRLSELYRFMAAMKFQSPLTQCT